jgi:bacteriorhodopsin
MKILKWAIAALYAIGIMCILFGDDITGSWREGIVLFGYAAVGFSAVVTFIIALVSHRMQHIKAEKTATERSKYKRLEPRKR